MNSRRSPARLSITGARHPSARAGKRADDGEARIVGDFRHNPTANLTMVPFDMLSTSSENGGGLPMADARCSCGALTLTLPGPSKLVAACHCLDCQRRTGAPFGVGAFYPADAVVISGTPKQYTRDAESGGKVHNFFCPNCGSTVYWRADNLPSLIGVAVGALADPNYPAPVRSVFEQSKHHWVQIDGAVEHFQQSSVAKKSNRDTTTI